MADVVPQDVNEFIEWQLDCRVEALEKKLESDIITFVGPIVDGVDDIIRGVVEYKVASPPDRKRLVVILTTLGGYIEVAKRIAEAFRHNYEYVAFVIPNYAFSAGTVLVMSGDDIYMDYYSRLGPIDPQVPTEDGKMVPALGYLTQYNRLLEKANRGELTAVEAQIMLEFDQAELYKYEQARELSVSLLREWLARYKFKDWVETETHRRLVTDEMRAERAEDIARELNNTEKWHSHGHGISMEVLQWSSAS